MRKSKKKKKKKKKKEEVEENKNDWEEENKSLLNENQLRNLYYFSSSKSYSITLFSINILGKNIAVIYEINIQSNKATPQLIISCDWSSKKFADSSLSLARNSNEIKVRYNRNIKLFEKNFFYITWLTFKLNLEGFIEFSIRLRSNTLTTSLATGLDLESSIGAGLFYRVEGGIRGNLITFTLEHSITRYNSWYRSWYESYISVSLSGGRISLFIRISLFNRVKGELSKVIHDGWSKRISKSLY